MDRKNRGTPTGPSIWGSGFLRGSGQRLGVLRPGKCSILNWKPRFYPGGVAGLDVEREHLITFYSQEDLRGEAWHFTTTDSFPGRALAAEAKSLSIRFLESKNIALNKPVRASVLEDRAARAVDGDGLTSWSPSAGPPTGWRWICRGTSS